MVRALTYICCLSASLRLFTRSQVAPDMIRERTMNRAMAIFREMRRLTHWSMDGLRYCAFGIGKPRVILRNFRRDSRGTRVPSNTGSPVGGSTLWASSVEQSPSIQGTFSKSGQYSQNLIEGKELKITTKRTKKLPRMGSRGHKGERSIQRGVAEVSRELRPEARWYGRRAPESLFSRGRRGSASCIPGSP